MLYKNYFTNSNTYKIEGHENREGNGNGLLFQTPLMIKTFIHYPPSVSSSVSSPISLLYFSVKGFIRRKGV